MLPVALKLTVVVSMLSTMLVTAGVASMLTASKLPPLVEAMVALVLVAGVVGVVVLSVIGYVFFKYRDRGQAIPEQTHGKPTLEIVLTIMEHHANIVPWQMLAERRGATIRWRAMSRPRPIRWSRR